MIRRLRPGMLMVSGWQRPGRSCACLEDRTARRRRVCGECLGGDLNAWGQARSGARQAFVLELEELVLWTIGIKTARRTDIRTMPRRACQARRWGAARHRRRAAAKSLWSTRRTAVTKVAVRRLGLSDCQLAAAFSPLVISQVRLSSCRCAACGVAHGDVQTVATPEDTANW